ncbi:MAG: hypothetical protein JO353_07580 [Phycisphaerae bacterium]|nr:hypothetical protein [Phycisphaerae bacterium]
MPETPRTIEDIDSSVPPVTAGEKLYRRLLLGAWFKPGRPSPIPQRFFMPRPWVSEDRRGDYDGISVNRAALIDLETAARRPDNGEKAHVAEFAVSDAVDLGMTVQPQPLATDRSHAVIPELNSIDLRDVQKAVKIDEWAIALRNKATLIC